eukprot:296256-Pleurochrysis_carterae.AAC.1
MRYRERCQEGRKRDGEGDRWREMERGRAGRPADQSMGGRVKYVRAWARRVRACECMVVCRRVRACACMRARVSDRYRAPRDDECIPVRRSFQALCHPMRRCEKMR